MEFKAKPLPYMMGNAGDLIKHGLLSEFMVWYCGNNQAAMNYYDPFGGRPWQEPIHAVVEKRLSGLSDTWLNSIQANNRYWGSGQLVNHLVKECDGSVKVFCSDRDKSAKQDLYDSGLNLIELEGFDNRDAYSILNCKLANDCILLDPFDELEYINNQVLPKVMSKVIDERCYVFMFVLYRAKELLLWQDFQRTQQQLIGKSVAYLSLSCPPLANGEIAGESKFYSHIVLYLPIERKSASITSLLNNVKQYADKLQLVLNSPIGLNYQV